MIHRRENRKILSSCYISHSASISSLKTQVVLQSFILCGKHFGRLKFPYGVIFNVLFSDGETFCAKLKSSSTFSGE